MENVIMIQEKDLEQFTLRMYDLLKKKETKETATEDDIIDVKSAAKILGLSPATVYGKTHRKEIPFFKRGKKLRFSKSQLIEWLKAGENPVIPSSKENIKMRASEYLLKNKRF
jgi:excisionase family DNA binding protein